MPDYVKRQTDNWERTALADLNARAGIVPGPLDENRSAFGLACSMEKCAGTSMARKMRAFGNFLLRVSETVREGGWRDVEALAAEWEGELIEQHAKGKAAAEERLEAARQAVVDRRAEVEREFKALMRTRGGGGGEAGGV